MGSAWIIHRQQVVETMGGVFQRRSPQIDSHGLEPGRRNADQQGRNALDPLRKVPHSLSDQFAARQAGVPIQAELLGHALNRRRPYRARGIADRRSAEHSTEAPPWPSGSTAPLRWLKT